MQTRLSPGRDSIAGMNASGKALLVLVSLALGLLCLAALDDITTGSEPSLAMEWAMVAATVAWFAGLARRRRSRS